MSTKPHPLTHRCSKLQSGMSIRLIEQCDIVNGIYVSTNLFKWTLSKLKHDWEWDTKSLSPVCHIEYCPFCGERLKINIDKV